MTEHKLTPPPPGLPPFSGLVGRCPQCFTHGVIAAQPCSRDTTPTDDRVPAEVGEWLKRQCGTCLAAWPEQLPPASAAASTSAPMATTGQWPPVEVKEHRDRP